MTKDSTIVDLMEFPITGSSVARLLKKFPVDHYWNIEELEVLASQPNDGLRSLLGTLRVPSVSISSLRLCEALESADQIVALLARSQENDGTELSIEDGDLLTLSIAAKSRT